MANIEPPRADPRRPGVADSNIEAQWLTENSTGLARTVALRSRALAMVDQHGLKPLPARIPELMSLLRDPERGMEKARTIIEHDPVLAMHVIRAANSAFLGGFRPVRSVQDSIVRIGPKRVLAVIAGAAALGVLNDRSGTAIRILQHCADVADVATVIAEGGAGDSTLAALVHDIGQLLILQVSPGLSAVIVEDGEHTAAVEETVLGFDHAILGEIILERWGFPAVVSAAVGMHHAVGRLFDNPGAASVIAARIRIAEFIVRGTSAGATIALDQVLSLPEVSPPVQQVSPLAVTPCPPASTGEGGLFAGLWSSDDRSCNAT